MQAGERGVQAKAELGGREAIFPKAASTPSQSFSEQEPWYMPAFTVP